MCNTKLFIIALKRTPAKRTYYMRLCNGIGPLSYKNKIIPIHTKFESSDCRKRHEKVTGGLLKKS